MVQQMQMLLLNSGVAWKKEEKLQAWLAQWAKEELKLNKAPNRRKITRILKYAGKFRDISIHKHIAFGKQRSEVAPQHEEALYNWICYNTNNGKQIDGRRTVDCVERLQISNNKHKSSDNRLNLKFFDRRVFCLKTRNGLWFKRVCKEALKQDDSAIKLKMFALLSINVDYKICVECQWV